MGTAHSAAARTQRGSKKARINRLRQTQAEIDELEKHIHELKILLYRTQVEGIMKRDERDEEIYDISTLTYQMRTDLIKKVREVMSMDAIDGSGLPTYYYLGLSSHLITSHLISFC